MGTNAAALAEAARKGSGAPEAAKALFQDCKSCHDQFRVPED
jgi:cytochrome c556